MLGCTIKPKLGLSAKNYGRAVYECLRGGLDFTKDDENVNSSPSCAGVNRFEFVPEAIDKAEAETGERKGHYLNVTAATPEEMYERAEYAKEIGSDHHARLHDRRLLRQHRLAKWCRKNGMLLHIHRAMHAVIDRNPKHGIHFRVLTKMPAPDPAATTCTPAPWWASSKATARPPWAGSTSCASPSPRRPQPRHVSSIRTGAPCPACSPWPPAVSMCGTCRRWSPSSATTRCCSSVAAPWAIPGATPPARLRQPRGP
jgi:hypothetical protein